MSLLKRTPGAALLDVLPPPDRREALHDIDMWQGRAEVAEAERDQLAAELRDVAAQRDAAVVERDDLSVRVLPELSGSVWTETAEPPGAVIGDELARSTWRVAVVIRIPCEPGTTPLDHLKHTLDAFADSDCPDDKLAIVATTNIFPETRTGLTWGDLRAIARELDPS